MVSEAAWAVCAFMYLLLFLAEFANESSDIVHELQPNAATNLTLEMMRMNYDPLD